MNTNPYQSPTIGKRPGGADSFWRALSPRNVLAPLVLGGIAVVAVLPINGVAFALWLVLLVRAVRKHLRQKCGSLAVSSALVQAALMIAIVTAAHLAPVKTTDRVLELPISVPSARMTIGELQGDPDEVRPEWRPHWVSVWAPDDELATEIVFPDTEMAMSEFVHAVESQSTLSHRFGHCGNGWTVLWGGDCSFGLYLRRPPKR